MRSLSTALPHQQMIVTLEVPNGYQPWLQDSCDVTPCSRVPDDIIRGPVGPTQCLKGDIHEFRIYEGLGLATRCDEIDHFAAILRVLEASQTIAGISLKIAAVWPVTFPRRTVFLLSCDAHCCDGNQKYLTDNFEADIT